MKRSLSFPQLMSLVALVAVGLAASPASAQLFTMFPPLGQHSGTVAQGETKYFGPFLHDVGNDWDLSVTLKTVSGDADLYFYKASSHFNTNPATSTLELLCSSDNGGTATETLGIEDGCHDGFGNRQFWIAVKGYAASSFQLTYDFEAAPIDDRTVSYYTSQHRYGPFKVQVLYTMNNTLIAKNLSTDRTATIRIYSTPDDGFAPESQWSLAKTCAHPNKTCSLPMAASRLYYVSYSVSQPIWLDAYVETTPIVFNP